MNDYLEMFEIFDLFCMRSTIWLALHKTVYRIWKNQNVKKNSWTEKKSNIALPLQYAKHRKYCIWKEFCL